MKMQIDNAQVIILFTILFVVVGYLAPVMYAAYAPQSHYVEVNNFEAQNTTTADTSHLICFDRDIEHGSSATVFTELYLVNGDSDSRVEVDSTTMERYFQEGDYAVETKMNLPEHMEAREYRYILVMQMDLAQGRVTREFEFQSEPFTVVESDEAMTDNTTTADFSC